jgi:hypothetical protein
MRLPASAPTGERSDQARVGTWSFDLDRSMAHGRRAASVQPHRHSSAPAWQRASAGLVLHAPTRIGGQTPLLHAPARLMGRLSQQEQKFTERYLLHCDCFY